MSVHKNKSIYTARSNYVDRTKENLEAFAELTVKISTLNTALLLLYSDEETVLVAVFKHIVDYMRKRDENIKIVQEKNVFDLLLNLGFFSQHSSIIVRRFALYMAVTLLESIKTLVDFDEQKAAHVLDTCIRFYITETDDFCLEYLSVMINKCLNDPQLIQQSLTYQAFINKLFPMISKTENPDALLHSFGMLYKMLTIMSVEEMEKFCALDRFPIDRVLCDLSNEFVEIRSAALRIAKLLIVDTSEASPFAKHNRDIFVLQQLTSVLSNPAMSENTYEVVDTLAMGLRTEHMTQLFFEQNLFDKVVLNLKQNETVYEADTKCRIIAIFAECALYGQFLQRMYNANIMDIFLNCLLQTDAIPFTHVMVGLNRMLKYPDAADKIVAAYEQGVIVRLLSLMLNRNNLIKMREQAAELVCSLLVYAFHATATELFTLKLPEVLADIFAQGMEELSVDFILTLLSLIEHLAQNHAYREALGMFRALAAKLAQLLKKSFATAILVSGIFRCFCTLIDESVFRDTILHYDLTSSIKRGLQSLANLVKTSVTNFIMQTTRFSRFVRSYINDGVLEVLILRQKHAFCVSTWGPAIDAILSKSPSYKFCIRNYLGFTDTTCGHDFYLSKQKFDDFRVFHSIIKSEVSPLFPLFVVNFERTITPLSQIVLVPPECFVPTEPHFRPGQSWCYTRAPGDEVLPTYLENVVNELERLGLWENPERMKRCIDFDNIAKRAKVLADVVDSVLSEGLESLDLTSEEECARFKVKCHLKELCAELHCNIIPLGKVRMGCKFERATLFKVLADKIGLPCTLQRSVDSRMLYNELPLPLELEKDVHCDKATLQYLPWRMLRPTHVIDLLYNVGDLYPMQSRQALQYLRLY